MSSLLPVSLERFLQVTGERAKVISANLANVDTPGYHAKDIAPFEQTLFRAGLEANPNGDPALSALPVSIRDERGLLERPDGNNVDLDQESLALAKTQLQFGLGIQMIKGHFHELLTAINSGA